MKSIKILCLAVFFCSMNVVYVYAESAHGIRFEPSYREVGGSMPLKGTALKRVLFMKAFVAGFYLDGQASPRNVLQNVSKRIEVSYFVRIPGVKLAHYTESLIKKNTTKKEFGLLKKRIETMGRYFVDLNPGDRYALTYAPGVGTKFEHNGKVVGVIEGDDFARGLFAVWVGEHPMDKSIKNQILGLT